MDNKFLLKTNFDILPIQIAGIIFNTADNGRSLQKNKS